MIFLPQYGRIPGAVEVSALRIGSAAVEVALCAPEDYARLLEIDRLQAEAIEQVAEQMRAAAERAREEDRAEGEG